MLESGAPKIAIVAGEPSGDNLAAGLIRELLKTYPCASFFGIGGPRMREHGCDTWYDMTSIELIGVDDLFGKINNILRIRSTLLSRLLADPPDVFIGIDVPDFNLSLEKKLKQKGMPTIHYVSPTVWAWRGYRIHKIRRSVSHMLVLFPFEEQYYQQRNIPVTFIGHPIADDLCDTDQQLARDELGINVANNETVIALLPGSRRSEMKRLATIFVCAAKYIANRKNPVRFLLPLANNQVKQIFEQLVVNTELPIDIYDGKSKQVMAASDLVVLASGTAALESALLGRPYVMVYKLSAMMYFLFKLLRHVRYYSMPNHLIEGEKIPELIQHKATAENIVQHVCNYLENPQYMQSVRQQFSRLPQMLKQDSNKLAAQVVASYLEGR